MEIKDEFLDQWVTYESEHEEIWGAEEISLPVEQRAKDSSVNHKQLCSTVGEMKANLLNLPPDIQEDKNFVTWIELKKANGKIGKIPASVETGEAFPSGTYAHKNPKLWVDLATLLNKGYHRALYFTSTDNDRIMIDIDDCASLVNGRLEIIPEAIKVLERFDSYAELSPSNKGIRIVVNGKTPLDKGYRGVKVPIGDSEVGFEIIAYERGATLTGNIIAGYEKPVANNQDAIDWYCNQYLSKYVRINEHSAENTQQVPIAIQNGRKIAKGGKLFEDINSSLNFRNFIAQHRGIAVRNSGDRITQLTCLTCNNQSTSKRKQDSALVVYEDNLFCFRCKKSWNAWSYLQEFDGVTGRERVETLCKYAGLDLSQYNNTDLKQAEASADGIPYYRLLAKEFYEYQPYYFDGAKIFWLWNKDKLVWQIKDETDLINAFEDLNPEMDTSIASVKNRLFEEIRKIGRKKQPMEPDKNWLQFNNTIIDYNDRGTKMEPNHRYFMKNVIPWDVSLDSNVDYLNLEDSDAILGQSDTPVTDKLLIDWAGVGYLKTMYEIIGFVLIRDYPLNRIICLLGPGSNGKSCFIRLKEKIIGTGNYTSSDIHRLANTSFESAKLYNKLMCTINEIDQSVFRQTALLKRLTGGDLVNMEMKFKNPFDASNYAKLIIASNTLPQTNDKSHGFFRRWLIIDFPNQFEEGRDPVLDIPAGEIPKVCGKAVKLIPDLLERGTFTNEGDLEQRKAKYQIRSSSVVEFINEYCNQIDGEYITCTRFIEIYRGYCRDHGYPERSSKGIGKEMSDVGFPSIQKRVGGYNQRVYANLCWKNGIVD